MVLVDSSGTAVQYRGMRLVQMMADAKLAVMHVYAVAAADGCCCLECCSMMKSAKSRMMLHGVPLLKWCTNNGYDGIDIHRVVSDCDPRLNPR